MKDENLSEPISMNSSKSITINTSDFDESEYIYNHNPDMFVYNGVAYILLGSVEETKLSVGTEIYLAKEKSNILLIKVDDKFIRYLAWIEG